MEYMDLGKICNIKTGKLDANASSENGNYPFFTCSKEPLKIDSYSYDCECILVAGNGDLNVKYYNGKFDAYQRTYIIEVTDKMKYSTKFLYLLINSKIDELRKASIGGVIKYIKLGNLTNIKVPVLSIEEQQKIVEKMFSMDRVLEIKKNQLFKFEELIKSQFVEMFENDAVVKKQLKSIAKIGSSKRIYASEYKNSGIPFYRSKEIRELGTGLKPSVELFIDESKYNYVKDKFGVPKKGDILVAAIGATIGYMWIVDDSKFYYKDGNLINISPFDKVSSIYLKYVLEKIINDYKIKNASGSAQLAMTIEKIEKFEIPVPPLELQSKFAHIVEQIDKQKFVGTKKPDC